MLSPCIVADKLRWPRLHLLSVSSSNGSVGLKAGRREWIGLGVIALPCLLYSMDLTVLNLALPSLSADLAPSSAQLLWIVDIYGFLVGGCLITMGTLGDHIGRRRLLMFGAVAFGAASVCAAFSPTAEMLIVSRAVLGLAGATLAPSTLSLIRNMFLDPDERRTAIGVWVSSYSVGAAIGPLIGGVLLEYFWWGSVFLIGVPVMLVLLLLGPILLPESRDPAAGRLDIASAALSLICVLAVIYGLKHTAQEGPSWTATAVIAFGLVVGLIFVRRQLHLCDPLIDMRLFRAPVFATALATYTIGTFVAFGLYIFISQYLQLVARAVATRGRVVDRAVRGLVHRWFHAHPEDRTPPTCGAGARRWARLFGAWFCADRLCRRPIRTRPRGGWVCHLRHRARAGIYSGNRCHRR